MTSLSSSCRASQVFIRVHVHLVTVRSMAGSYSHLCVPGSQHCPSCSRRSADKHLGINWTLTFLIYFYWSAVDLHCCANLCCTAKWLSYIPIDILFFLSIISHCLSQDIEYSSLCYTVGCYSLSETPSVLVLWFLAYCRFSKIYQIPQNVLALCKR